jgi:hypothetical protein
MAAVHSDGVLARHPCRLLKADLLQQGWPVEFIAECVESALPSLDEFLHELERTELPAECRDTLAKSSTLISYAVEAKYLASRQLMALLDPASALAKNFQPKIRRLMEEEKVLWDKQAAAAGWREKLPPQDAALALSQARAFERDPLRFFKPAWWKLRAVLRRCYDFSTHQFAPSWVQVLTWLDAEHQATARFGEAEAQVCREYGIDEPMGDFARRVEHLATMMKELPEPARQAKTHILQSGDADARITALAELQDSVAEVRDELGRFLHDHEALPFAELRAAVATIGESLDELPDWLECLRELAALPAEVAGALRSLPYGLGELEAAAAQRSFDEITRSERWLVQFTGGTRDQQVQQLDRLTRDWQEANAELVCERVRNRFLENVKLSSLPAAQLSAEQKDLKKQYSRGRRELEHEFGKSMRYKPIRDLVANDTGLVVRDLKPVWLMSPLSVSDTLPLDPDHFDVVIFDEASQVLLEEAVPSLFRAKQTIVVGDEMQLPPTNFFSARRAEEDEQLSFEEEGEQIAYDLEGDSFLNHAGRNLPSRMLGWHYRSRSESLISFSNWAFYQGRLLTVPDENLAQPGRADLRAKSAGDAVSHLERLLDRPVSFHFMEHGIYEKRRNRAEAEYIAELVRGLLRQPSRPSIGIVAFSEAQQGEIEAALERLSDEDDEFRERLEEEFTREEDDQFVGLLVKNLENIQGDERDIIILSVCYGHGPDGRMRMNFGPINQSGGEKRLNVAFSRSKRHMALVSSIHGSAITNEYNDGANCLRNYLLYAEACSTGDMASAQRILRSLALLREPQVTERPESEGDAVVDQLEAALRERGYLVDRAVGQSHFQCDLAVRREGDDRYRLGIFVDTDRYYEQSDILERDLMKPKLLEAFGWKIAVVLTKDWCVGREEVLEQLIGQAEIV